MPRQANTRTPSSSRAPPGRGTNCGSVARQPGSSQLAATCQQPIRGEHCGHVTVQRPVIGPHLLLLHVQLLYGAAEVAGGEPEPVPVPAITMAINAKTYGSVSYSAEVPIICVFHLGIFQSQVLPVFLAGKVWVDGHELQGAVVLVLRHGGQQLRLEVHGGVGQSEGRLRSRDPAACCDWSPGGRRWCWPRASRGPRCP